MKTLKEFLTESTSNNDIYKESLKIVVFLSTKIGQTYVEFDGQNYTNTTGNYFGFLFVSQTDNSAIRINWEGTKFHSISFWLDWDLSKDPTKEIFVEDAEPGKTAFAKLLPDIANILLDLNSFIEDEDEQEKQEMSESMLTERKVEYKGQLYGNKAELVIKLYEDEVDLEDIKKIVQLDSKNIKSILTKYLYRQGGSVSDIADALSLNKINVRNFVATPDKEDTDVVYSDKIKILAGYKETVVQNKVLKKNEDKLAETQYADPDFVFEEITDYVTMIGKQLLTSLVITGQGEIGKSYNVEKILNDFGKFNETWVKITGKPTTFDIYKTLWENRDKIVVFEDCDGIFKDADSINLLKKVLDTSRNRELSFEKKNEHIIDTSYLDNNEEIEETCQNWSEENRNKEAIPSNFFFEGNVIFISNMTKSEINETEPELLGDCTCVDIVSSSQDTMNRLKTILPHLKVYKTMDSKGNLVKDITDEDIKYTVIDFMSSDTFTKNPNRRGKEITYRTFDSIYKLCYADLENWKDLALFAE